MLWEGYSKKLFIYVGSHLSCSLDYSKIFLFVGLMESNICADIVCNINVIDCKL